MANAIPVLPRSRDGFLISAYSSPDRGAGAWENAESKDPDPLRRSLTRRFFMLLVLLLVLFLQVAPPEMPKVEGIDAIAVEVDAQKREGGLFDWVEGFIAASLGRERDESRSQAWLEGWDGRKERPMPDPSSDNRDYGD